MMKPQDLPRELAIRIEQAEVHAWEDFYAAAPAALSAAMSLDIDRLGKTVFTLCPPIPFIMFNRAINLGIAEPATEALLDALIDRYRAQRIADFCIHHVPVCEPEPFERWLRQRGLAPSGGWERIWRDDHAPAFGVDPDVEKIDAARGAEWAEFLFNLYHIPVQPWLLALVGRPGWHHYALRRDGRIVAVRSQFVDDTGAAWMGVEAPIPGAMAPSFEDDRRICQTMIVDGLAHGIRIFSADIEVPAADRCGPAYDGFEWLGFRLAYLRQHFRPVPAAET